MKVNKDVVKMIKMCLFLKSSPFDCHSSSAIRPFAIRRVIQISKAHIVRPGEREKARRSPPSLPAYPKFLTGFCFLPPSLPSPSLRPLSAFPLPPFSLHSSFPLFQMSTRLESKSALLMLSGMTGRKVRECLLAPFLQLELDSLHS